MKRRAHGFTLIELLVVLAIMGAISAVAIPQLLGQRRRARVEGDAMAAAQALRMVLEAARADSGQYGPNNTYTWVAGNAPASSSLAQQWPNFQPGNSRMNFTVTIPSTTGGGIAGMSYTLFVYDATRAGTPLVYQTDDTGAELFRQR